MTTPESCLGNVRIVYHTGAEYLFPHMNLSDVRKMLPEPGRIPTSTSCLSLVNVPIAAMSIPLRIINKIYLNDEEVWHA